MEFLPVTIDGKRVYAGFWKRLNATFIDGFVLLPIFFFFLWVKGFDRFLAIVIAIPSTALFSMYSVYFNARFGGTIGKLAVGIRIVKPNGSQIGWLEAWKRSSVDLVFAVIMLVAEVWALTQVDAGQYSATPFVERMGFLLSFYPAWFTLLDNLHTGWFLSELVVLLFNKRKRALHDFIAGTVVINKEFAEKDALALHLEEPRPSHAGP